MVPQKATTRNLSALFMSYARFAQIYTQLLGRVLRIGGDTTNVSGPVDYLSGVSFKGGPNSIESYESVKIWYNTKGYDSSVSYLNVLNNAILRSKLKLVSKDTNNFGIVAYNHPMPFITSQFLEQISSQVTKDLFVAIFIIFALSFIPASFLVFILEEREANVKQLEFVSGVKPYIYWLSNVLWDLVNYGVPICICICVFLLFDVKSYTTQENLPCLILLMFLYGWAVIPLMYPLNYVFEVPSTAFVVASSLNVFLGVITTITTTTLEQLGQDEPDLKRINQILKPIFIILFPHYCLGQGFIVMAIEYNTSEANKILGRDSQYDPFEFDKVGRNLLAMFCQGNKKKLLNFFVDKNKI
jgi:ATP-binding cassette subfamily A (ABC1) protein 1